jgi:hypothetical protein
MHNREILSSGGLGGGEEKRSNIHAKKAVIDRQPKALIAAYIKAHFDRRF